MTQEAPMSTAHSLARTVAVEGAVYGARPSVSVPVPGR